MHTQLGGSLSDLPAVSTTSLETCLPAFGKFQRGTEVWLVGVAALVSLLPSFRFVVAGLKTSSCCHFATQSAVGTCLWAAVRACRLNLAVGVARV